MLSGPTLWMLVGLMYDLFMYVIAGLVCSAIVDPSTIGCGERPSISRKL